MGGLDVIWEDAHGLAVNKPAGLLTQPARAGDDAPNLEALVRLHLRPGDPGSVYVGTVHRLDRPVSGIILWAKTPKAAQRWARQFAERRTIKEYWAIIERGPAGRDAGAARWEDWLLSPDQAGQARTASEGTPGSVRAITRVERGDPTALVAADRFAWIKLRPETGRTHQLRAQAAARGCPIVGDATYGSAIPFATAGIALHARRLIVEHPARREPMTLEAPLPAAWSAWLVDR